MIAPVSEYKAKMQLELDAPPCMIPCRRWDLVAVARAAEELLSPIGLCAWWG